MQNSPIGKVFVASAILVVLIGLVLHFTRGRPEMPVPATSPAPDSVASGRPPRPDIPVPEAEASEPKDADPAGLAKLPREKVEEYLTRNHRSAAGLLAAFHALDDTNYLNEAAANFPNDPQLQWTILARDAFPEARRRWLDRFKASSPDNSLPNYLSAADYLKKGQSDAALKELLEAAGKPQFKEYAMDARLDEEELSRVAGRTALESIHVAGWAADHLPELATFKSLANGINDLRREYLAAGDSVSANNLTQMQLTLASRLTAGEGGKLVINQLVGLAVEAIALKQLDSNTAYDFLGGKTPTEMSEELKQQKQSFRESSKSFQATLGNLTEAEMVAYHDRMKVYGEVEAMRWLQQRFGTNSPP